MARELSEDLAGIAAAASTLSERLTGSFTPCAAGTNEAAVTHRLERWEQVVAEGDGARFARRLAWDGIDLGRVLPLLGDVRLADGVPLPGWLATLTHLVNAAPKCGTDSTARFLDRDDPLPCEDVLLPWVRLAQQRVIEAAGAAYQQLEPAAHASLERCLLRRLAYFSAPVLTLEFAVARDRRRSQFERLLFHTEEEAGRAEYQRFVTQLLGDFTAFFRRYPVLARLQVRTIDLWVAATREMLERLAQDRDAIGRVVFGDAGDLGSVVEVEAGLSDPHRGGRTVAVLTFQSGHKVVYKPKDVGPEHAFGQLLTWLNDRGAPLPFKATRVLPRADYGWVEHVPHLPCAATDEAHRFYRRAGQMLSLVYALAGTDCHRENLVACGEHLVLIDVETLLHHRLRIYPDSGGAWELARAQLDESVLKTGLLPSWQTEDGQLRASDVSALHTPDADELTIQASRWCNVNTDRMALGRASVRLPLPTSQPLLGDVPLRLEDYAADLLKGFEDGYRFLLAERTSLLQADSPLYCLGSQPVRLIHRNTRAYGSLHETLRDPAWLRNGADRSIQLERLARSMVTLGPQDGQTPCWWPLIADEQMQMEEGDVPYFSAPADRATVTLSSGQPVDGCIRTSGRDRVVERLTKLGDADLAQQRALTAGAIYSHIARGSIATRSMPDVSPSHRPEPGRYEPTLNQSTDALAIEIAAHLAATAIRGADDSAIWIGPQFLTDINRYQLQPIAFDLNTGACGVALFLAAVEHATGVGGYRDLAVGALAGVRSALRDHGDELADEIGIGGATGVGSIVYTLGCIGHWFQEPTLLADAAAAAALLDDERIAQAPDDVFLGTAGAALALLRLYEAAPTPEVLERAAACGYRLLKTRSVARSGHRTWVTVAGRPLTGFSHGAAGIAYVLLRLTAATGDAEYREGALEAIAYEDELFDPAVDNWPDLREPAQPAYAMNWCHGAPGIGLARLGGLVALDTADIRADIDAAVRATLRLDLDSLDHVCCGNLGRLDLLLEAGHRLGRCELVDAARERGQAIVQRAQTATGLRLDGGLPAQVASPGFFQGLAGIGYQLLRLTRPRTLPSVLLWQ